jgi:TetR/AcrR family transcriptional regulator
MAPRTGERKAQILQALAEILQDPKGEKITTAALAARLDVSEAALYRHFASKAQMYEGLIGFIEESVFGLINKIGTEQESGLKQAHATAAMLLSFAEKNPGMTRVLIGDVLLNEDERLQARINQLHDRLEATLKQSLRLAATQGEIDKNTDVAAQANLMLAYITGRWHQYAKSGFKRLPTELWQKQGPMLLG